MAQLAATGVETREMTADSSSGEAALVALAQNGDRAAFSTLIERHYDTIHRVAWKWSGDPHDAEDIAQEVCVRLATALQGFDGRAAFSSWLYRITLNAVRDRQRQHQRRAAKANALAAVSDDRAAGEQEEAVAATELWRAVQTLPEKQRDAVLLIYAEEKSHAEAAEIMGVKEATVSWHVHEARKALRGLM